MTELPGGPLVDYALLVGHGAGLHRVDVSNYPVVLAGYAALHWGIAWAALWLTPGRFGVAWASLVMALWLLSAVRYATYLGAVESARAEELARWASGAEPEVVRYRL